MVMSSQSRRRPSRDEDDANDILQINAFFCDLIKLLTAICRASSPLAANRRSDTVNAGNVPYWHKADIAIVLNDVCFWRHAVIRVCARAVLSKHPRRLLAFPALGSRLGA